VDFKWPNRMASLLPIPKKGIGNRPKMVSELLFKLCNEPLNFVSMIVLFSSRDCFRISNETKEPRK